MTLLSLFFRCIAEGNRPPWWMGVFYSPANRRAAYWCPIPLNLLLAWTFTLWGVLRFPQAAIQLCLRLRSVREISLFAEQQIRSILHSRGDNR